MFNNYLDKIFKTSESYLKKQLNYKELESLKKVLSNKKLKETEECVSHFINTYTSVIKKKYQSEHKEVDKKLEKFLEDKDTNLKVIWGDCLNVLKKMNSESVQLMVTSPPYYNAREYSQWKDMNDYLDDMRVIIKETFRVLDNHRVWVFNVGDIFANPKIKTQSVWGKQRIPLGAYFIKIFEELK